MGGNLFIGGSVILFSVYVLAANALGITGEGIDPITVPAAPNRGGFNGFVDSILSAFTFAFELFAQFLELITFQVPGYEAASLVTVLIWTPIAAINAMIIFSKIRGS